MKGLVRRSSACDPYLNCISTTFNSLPPALHVAFATSGVSLPSITSDIKDDINRAKSSPVVTPAAAMVRLLGVGGSSDIGVSVSVSFVPLLAIAIVPFALVRADILVLVPVLAIH